MTPPFGPMVWVVMAYCWGEQVSRSVILPRVPTTAPVRSPIRPKLGVCCSLDGASGAVESDVVQLSPAASANARASVVNLRFQFIGPLRAKGERRATIPRPVIGRRTERAQASAAGGPGR